MGSGVAVGPRGAGAGPRPARRPAAFRYRESQGGLTNEQWHPTAVRSAFSGMPPAPGVTSSDLPDRSVEKGTGSAHPFHPGKPQGNARARDWIESVQRWATNRLRGEPSPEVPSPPGTGRRTGLHARGPRRPPGRVHPRRSPCGLTHQRWATRPAAVEEMPSRRIPGHASHAHGKFPAAPATRFRTKRQVNATAGAEKQQPW
jgi:hypothetical protein